MVRRNGILAIAAAALGGCSTQTQSRALAATPDPTAQAILACAAATARDAGYDVKVSDDERWFYGERRTGETDVGFRGDALRGWLSENGVKLSPTSFTHERGTVYMPRAANVGDRLVSESAQAAARHVSKTCPGVTVVRSDI